MREHPIPQDITNYRFHIIGNMTLKQFGLLAFGCLIALGIYTTNLPAVIRWPLIVIFVGIGVVAAFIPIAERPLDHWIMTFFRRLYQPTLFYWKREEHIPLAFTYVQRTDLEVYEPEIDLGPARRERIIEYMRSINTSYVSKDEYTNEELFRLQSITTQFDSVQVPANLTQTQKPENHHRPSLDVKIRKINPDVGEQVLQSLRHHEQEEQAAQPKADVVDTTQHHKVILEASQVGEKITIPEQKYVQTEHQVSEEEENIAKAQNDTDDRAFIESEAPEAVTATQGTHFNTSLPFPIKPTEPNKLVGMVLTPQNDLVTDAIVEIQTKDGHIVRAVKTNALGQFFISTPLRTGEYVIHVEKDEHQFEPQSISLSGKIVEPIEVRSTT